MNETREMQISRWTTAAVSVGIFVVGLFTLSLRAEMSEIGKQIETARGDALEYFQNQAEDHSEMWRRIGFLEAKIEAFEAQEIINSLDEIPQNEP